MGLVQGELERRGIVTVSVTMLPEITSRIGVPRAVEVPFPLGFPLGEADNPRLQRSVIEAMLAIAGRTDVPVLERLS